MAGSEVTTIPKIRRVFYTTFALFPVTGITAEDLAYATDTGRLYRWSGAAWQAITPDPTSFGNALINSGNYVGNDSVNRAIAHGLGIIPKVIFIAKSSIIYRIQSNLALIFYTRSEPAFGYFAVTIMDANNFYVGNATNYTNSGNSVGDTFFWVAIG